jgi:nucleoside-diphosphate-sugar epimerase
VDDIARGTIAALRPLGYDTINLGSDQPVVLMDAVRLVERLTGQTAVIENRPAHPADVTATWADVSRAGQILGWKPQVSFEGGVQALVDWYQAERAWASQIETGL